MRLLDFDTTFIWGYCGTVAFAGLAPIVGLGRDWPAVWPALAGVAWLAAVAAMGRADTIENAQMAELLLAGPDAVEAGHHDAAIDRMGKAARAKFGLLLLEIAVTAILWVAFVLKH